MTPDEDIAKHKESHRIRIGSKTRDVPPADLDTVKILNELFQERYAQRVKWGNDNDDRHTGQDLARAAACFAVMDQNLRHEEDPVWPDNWRYNGDDTYREALVKAGSLIVAEIERLDRSAK